ncbi:hypothetical protein HYQ44_017032 [Verticillium longisporum]|nr:hypothetical protein HYQ44_017032 [Verticillium longisporum]
MSPKRDAARKCRVRKQRGIEDLQTQEAAIDAVNQCLKDQYTELRGEVLLLKNMILHDMLVDGFQKLPATLWLSGNWHALTLDGTLEEAFERTSRDSAEELKDTLEKLKRQ